MKDMLHPAKYKHTMTVPLLIVGILFFVIGFGVGISGFLIIIFFCINAFEISLTPPYERFTYTAVP
jgi:hypothetical protein